MVTWDWADEWSTGAARVPGVRLGAATAEGAAPPRGGVTGALVVKMY